MERKQKLSGVQRILIIAAAVFMSIQLAWAGNVADTKHNLASNTANDYRAVSGGTTMVCIFCHTPHSPIGIPLWNRYPGIAPLASYRLYSTSPTMKNIANNSGISEQSVSSLCINCHDGSPLGGASLRIQPVDGLSTVMGPNGEVGIAPERKTHKGPDLRNHHPVNFNVTVGGAANGLGEIIETYPGYFAIKTSRVQQSMPLFTSPRGDRTLECASCHTVHNNDSKPFLRTTMAGNVLCLACHVQ